MTLKVIPSYLLGLMDTLLANADGGKLAVYTSARPADPTVAVTSQTKLVDFTMNADAFAAATAVSGGIEAVANAISNVNALAGGDANWFRLSTSGGAAILDGDVTNQAGAGDLKLASISISAGVTTTVISLKVTQAKGD